MGEWDFFRTGGPANKKKVPKQSDGCKKLRTLVNREISAKWIGQRKKADRLAPCAVSKDARWLDDIVSPTVSAAQHPCAAPAP